MAFTKMAFVVLSILLTSTKANWPSPKPPSSPTPKPVSTPEPTPVPTNVFQSMYCEYNIAGLVSEHFEMVQGTSELALFEEEMEEEIYDCIVADSSIVATNAGGLDSVTVSGTSMDEDSGTIDLEVTIDVHWSLIDELEANQQGETGDFSSLMTDHIRTYFNDSDERIQFSVDSVGQESSSKLPLIMSGVVISVIILMYL